MANIIVNIADFTQNPLSVAKVTMLPLYPYSVAGEVIISSDALTNKTDGTGNTLFNNVVAGLYQLELVGPYAVTTIKLTVADSQATLNAKDLIGVPLTNPDFTVAYSKAQSDTRYMSISGSGATLDTSKVVMTTGDQSISGRLSVTSLIVNGSSNYYVDNAGNLTLQTVGFYGSNTQMTSGVLQFDADHAGNNAIHMFGGAIDGVTFLTTYGATVQSNLSVAGDVSANRIVLTAGAMQGTLFAVDPNALCINAGIESNLTIQPHINLDSGVAFASVNDDNSANLPIEYRASEYCFSVLNGTYQGSAMAIGEDGNITVNGATSLDGGLIATDGLGNIMLGNGGINPLQFSYDSSAGGLSLTNNGTSPWIVTIDGGVHSQFGFSCYGFSVDGVGNLSAHSMTVSGNHVVTANQTGSFATRPTIGTVTSNAALSYSTSLLSGAAITGTLPSAVGIDGTSYTVKQITNGTGVVKGYSSQTIDGFNTRTLSGQYKFVTVQAYGSNWFVTSQG